ncbi:MAG TPA: 5-formyltetrahydrofolate cyclo-ligase [Acetivibrio sp.]|nr:5-formyltetrahydrofolate cyclo-ligase [Clostridium sp.]HOQ36206.1 5-formyltetrahydrofolate cyclo-ligase [Acetivibrio sp.]HPT90051.1 5-formyltetrahydrofolate cyclo-ligase [Acetivibrio sp.]HQA56952.1 5-formyltetrahydrofolate cyclo-ligase [Acetivibrio sp.]
MKSKKEIRKEILDKRNALIKDDVVKRSIRITEKLISLDKFKDSKIIMAYMDFKNEVMTGFLTEHCLKLGKTLAFPLIESIQGIKKICAYEPIDRENGLKPGTYGILEPVKHLSRKIDPQKIDMVIVPGVAFDTKGNRIGYGAGYYDVFLREVKDECFKVGIAFELQVVENIPKEEHDVVLDAIVTENRVILSKDYIERI